jgi:hypothetical protein
MWNVVPFEADDVVAAASEVRRRRTAHAADAEDEDITRCR